MNKYDVAVARYEEPLLSVRRVVELAGGFATLPADARVVVKPNFVSWHEEGNSPRYGVITTARILEDVLIVLKEHGFRQITIAEGIVEAERRSKSLMTLLAAGMGLSALEKRYGVGLADVHKGSFGKVSIAQGLELSFSTYITEADYIINVPVLKTHQMTAVSLGIKNMKGALDTASRKICHRPGRDPDLHACVAMLPSLMPPSFTIIDGIYTLERGATALGEAHRSNILVASRDLICADKVGARLLGYQPQGIRHIDLACQRAGRPSDLTDVNVIGEIDIETALKPHAHRFEYNQAQDMPLLFEQRGISGVRLPETDDTLCTYCGYFIFPVVMGILMASNKNRHFDDIEILTGGKQEPSKGHKHTVLVGKCQVQKNSANPLIRHCVPIRGCPPSVRGLLEAYKLVGIELPDEAGEWIKTIPEVLMMRYAGRPEFDESFYRIPA